MIVSFLLFFSNVFLQMNCSNFFVFMFQPFLSRYVCVQGGCIILNPPPLFKIFFFAYIRSTLFLIPVCIWRNSENKNKKQKMYREKKRDPSPSLLMTNIDDKKYLKRKCTIMISSVPAIESSSSPNPRLLVWSARFVEHFLNAPCARRWIQYVGWCVRHHPKFENYAAKRDDQMDHNET